MPFLYLIVIKRPYNLTLWKTSEYHVIEIRERIGGFIQMRSSSLSRSNLSNEKIAFLSEMKEEIEHNSFNAENNEPKAYKRPNRQKELDMLWQNFKIGVKDEKSPGVYLLTGFIAGALCMFIMNAVLSIGTVPVNDTNSAVLGQPKFEKTFSRKSKLPQINSQITVVPTESAEIVEDISSPATETYTVKSGDSMSSIALRFYGKYDPNKVEKIRQANNLTNAHKLSIGQELIIPLD